MMNVTCPKCRSRVAVPASQVASRQTLQCPTCTTPFTLTQAEARRFGGLHAPLQTAPAGPPTAGWWTRALERMLNGPR